MGLVLSWLSTLSTWLSGLTAWLKALPKRFFDWFDTVSVWLEKLTDWLMDLPGHVMDLVVFCLTYLVKIFSWLLHKFFRPFFDYLRDIEFPCLECVSTLWDAIDQLLAMDFNFSLGFDVVGFLRYLMGFINFGYGMEVIFCVLLARFILRRIPFIG